jgi:butyrate response factor 1
MEPTTQEVPVSVIAAGQKSSPWLRHFASEPLMVPSKLNGWYPQKSEPLSPVDASPSLETHATPKQQTPFATTMQKLTKKNSMTSIDSPAKNGGKSRSRAKRFSDPDVDIWSRLRSSESAESKLAADMRGLSLSRKKSGPITGDTTGLSTSPPPADHEGPGLYKTELCRSFAETGLCRYGLKCQFAHGKDELRPVQRHPKYKTEMCKTWASIGTCPYGTRCRFIHPKDDEFGRAFVELERKLEAEKAAAVPAAGAGASSRLSVFAEIASQPSPQPQRQLLNSEARRSENPGSA